MEFLGLLLISIGIMSLPFIFIRLYQGPGSVKFSFFNKSEKQKDRVHEMQDYVDKDKNIIAPTRAEILEKICQMTSIFRNITSSQLNITELDPMLRTR
jgi:hypothetical protein